MAGTFKIQGAGSVTSQYGTRAWSGGLSGTWLLFSDADLLTAINRADAGITNRYVANGVLLTGDPSAIGIDLIRFGFNSSDNIISLDGNSAVSLLNLPSNFIITSATLKVTGVGIPGVRSQLFLQSDSLTEHEIIPFNAGQTYSFAYDFTIPSNQQISSLLNRGFGIRVIFAIDNSVYAFFNAYIEGTYKIGATVTRAFPSFGGIFGGSGRSAGIEGKGFVDAGTLTAVYYDGIPATNVSILNDTHIDCDNPPHAAGPVYISMLFNGTDLYTSATQIFTYEQYSWNLDSILNPYRRGDKVRFSGTLLDGVTQIQLSYGDPTQTVVIYAGSYDIIVQTPYKLWFYIPIDFIPIDFIPTSFIPVIPPTNSNYTPPSGIVPITITLIGTQFSGSVIAGVINVLFEDTSGIYTLVKGQTNDILYSRTGYITDIKMLTVPDISYQEKTFEDDFFSMLLYPRKILAQDDSDEDYMLEDFSITSTLRVVVVTRSVEIPSPFVRTAFLP
jgi:hypothetical protein